MQFLIITIVLVSTVFAHADEISNYQEIVTSRLGTYLNIKHPIAPKDQRTYKQLEQDLGTLQWDRSLVAHIIETIDLTEESQGVFQVERPISNHMNRVYVGYHQNGVIRTLKRVKDVSTNDLYNKGIKQASQAVNTLASAVDLLRPSGNINCSSATVSAPNWKSKLLQFGAEYLKLHRPFKSEEVELEKHQALVKAIEDLASYNDPRFLPIFVKLMSETKLADGQAKGKKLVRYGVIAQAAAMKAITQLLFALDLDELIKLTTVLPQAITDFPHAKKPLTALNKSIQREVLARKEGKAKPIKEQSLEIKNYQLAAKEFVDISMKALKQAPEVIDPTNLVTGSDGIAKLGANVTLNLPQTWAGNVTAGHVGHFGRELGKNNFEVAQVVALVQAAPKFKLSSPTPSPMNRIVPASLEGGVPNVIIQGEVGQVGHTLRGVNNLSGRHSVATHNLLTSQAPSVSPAGTTGMLRIGPRPKSNYQIVSDGSVLKYVEVKPPQTVTGPKNPSAPTPSPWKQVLVSIDGEISLALTNGVQILAYDKNGNAYSSTTQTKTDSFSVVDKNASSISNSNGPDHVLLHLSRNLAADPESERDGLQALSKALRVKNSEHMERLALNVAQQTGPLNKTSIELLKVAYQQLVAKGKKYSAYQIGARIADVDEAFIPTLKQLLEKPILELKTIGQAVSFLESKNVIGDKSLIEKFLQYEHINTQEINQTDTHVYLLHTATFQNLGSLLSEYNKDTGIVERIEYIPNERLASSYLGSYSKNGIVTLSNNLLSRFDLTTKKSHTKEFNTLNFNDIVGNYVLNEKIVYLTTTKIVVVDPITLEIQDQKEISPERNSSFTDHAFGKTLRILKNYDFYDYEITNEGKIELKAKILEKDLSISDDLYTRSIMGDHLIFGPRSSSSMRDNNRVIHKIEHGKDTKYDATIETENYLSLSKPNSQVNLQTRQLFAGYDCSACVYSIDLNTGKFLLPYTTPNFRLINDEEQDIHMYRYIYDRKRNAIYFFDYTDNTVRRVDLGVTK